MRAEARAKVNLELRVRPGGGGLHPLRSLVQSVGWADTLEVEEAEEDVLEATGIPVAGDNLVWRALGLLRRARHPVRIRLDKRIPVAAGLGGGSADAAAALVLYARLTGIPEDELAPLASGVGWDVPFCLVGGLCRVEGHGERVTRLSSGPADHWLGIVVPPFELATSSVYRAWDRLGGPEGAPVAGRHLPPSLRSHDPLQNDLYPAAAWLAPELNDWRFELERRWGRPVLLSGSGPALFGFFLAEDEARSAMEEAPPTARAVRAVPPVDRGVEVT